MTAQLTLQSQAYGTGTLCNVSVIISLGSAATQPRVRLITVNYDAGRVNDCSPDEVSHDEIARD